MNMSPQTANTTRLQSGAYPTREPRTVDEIIDLLREQGYVAFRCDDGIIPDALREHRDADA